MSQVAALLVTTAVVVIANPDRRVAGPVLLHGHIFHRHYDRIVGSARHPGDDLHQLPAPARGKASRVS